MAFTRDILDEWRKRNVCAVFSSSPLIYLTRIGVLGDVLRVYRECYIPEGVQKEVIEKGMELYRPDAFVLDEYVKNRKIRVRKIENLDTYKVLSRNPLIHKADVEAICLAEESGCILVMDDPKGIEVAKLRGIRIEPTLTVILVCYAFDYISFEKGEHSYKELLKAQFRVKADIYERVLKFLGMIKDIKVLEEKQ